MTCLDLIRRFPLAEITDDVRNEEALAIIKEIWFMDRDIECQAYFNVLCHLVWLYEKKYDKLFEVDE